MASLNLKTFMSNKRERCLLNVQRASPGALRRGTACWNAAPQPSSPGSIQPVRSSRHAYCLDAKHADPLKPSILISPTFIPVFIKLPCPCQARCSGNLVRSFTKKLISIHTVILQRRLESLARNVIKKTNSTKKMLSFQEEEENVLKYKDGQQRLADLDF